MKYVTVSEKEIKTLFYFLKRLEDNKAKNALIMAFINGLARKLKGGK